MEVFLYNSTVCRLCGEENDNGTLLYSDEENNVNLSEVINIYLPIKVQDDGQLPRTICPGCAIQLEATVEFLTLIINGQKVIRELHLREREYKKTILNPAPEQDVITEKIVYEVNTSNGVYQVEHPIALQVAGLDKPKRKRGRPSKKHKTPEELAEEAAAKEREQQTALKKDDKVDEPTGKRRRKIPIRFREAVQGKELERIFKEEGVTDGEDSDREVKADTDNIKVPVSKEPEVIGHMENSGELVVFVKGKGRGRPKGPMHLTRKECAICGMEFSCAGRYMSHVAHHGPVIYQCSQCKETFDTQLYFNNHQKDVGHSGKNVISLGKKNAQKNQNVPAVLQIDALNETQPAITETPDVGSNMLIDNVMTSLPDLNDPPLTTQSEIVINADDATAEVNDKSNDDGAAKEENYSEIKDIVEVTEKTEEVEIVETTPAGKVRLKCNHCDKTFRNKHSKSMHIKAAHLGEKPHACAECGARFAYPRSLALHAVSHRRRRAAARGYACDLCGKVLNHPSSVVYHKEAEHAGERYVCNKCGKFFKHKQLLKRHQLVHTQIRPYTCKTCNASFKTKSNLLHHQLLHTGVKKFSCEICKNKFAHKTSLTLHMRSHTGVRPHSCATCGKSFSQKGNLSEHERIHSGEKPFQCALCPRRFTTSSQYRLHVRRHAGMGKRPPPRTAVRRGAHRCVVCARTFSERWTLLKHLRTHSGERPFRCAHCPRAFADCSNLNKHRKQVHKQISLLASSQPQPIQPVSPALSLKAEVLETDSLEDESSERIIYVTYDVDEPHSPAYHILSPEQAGAAEPCAAPPPCELLPAALQPLVLAPHDHMPVTDEQGNPLHFTMQDGTRLAITSADGKSLQVITQDGQTIPVEINGYADEEEVDNPDTIVHQLNLQKSVDNDVSSPVTHYFTIV